jgi:hypothetical protein
MLEEKEDSDHSLPKRRRTEANVNFLTDIHCREPMMDYPQMKSQLCFIRKVPLSGKRTLKDHRERCHGRASDD